MNKEHYLNIVEDIIRSKSFGRSDTYANMFRYLVKCTLENNVPKETTIASEIFGKDRFDPSQSTLIRVYAYNLRKKLLKYYENEGVNDTIILKIPKGGYEVSFIDISNQPKPKKTNVKIGFVLLASSLVLISILLFNYYKIDTVSKIKLWKGLIESKQTTMLVLGDLFMYKEIDSISGRIKRVRNPSVNSLEEFETLIVPKAKAGENFEALSYAFLIRNSITWVKDLSNVFFEAEKDFVIRTMSRFNPKELYDNDLIVVGMLKTLGIFKDYFNKEGISINESVLIYKDKKTGEEYKYSPDGDDYAVILKVPGPNNNNIYLFGGIWDTGTSQSLKNFTDFKFATTLEKAMRDKYGEIPENYKVLIEVSGIDRMELNSKIIHLEKIE